MNEIPPTIVDTNVVFSGLGPREGLPGSVLAGVFPNSHGIVSTALLDEYRRRLLSSKALAFTGLPREQIEAFLDALEQVCELVSTDPGPTCPDPDDQHLWDLLATAPDYVLVTGETTLLQSRHFPGRIFSPRDFVDRYLP